MSANRKLKRKAKKEAEKDLKEKINLFDKTPDKCNNCDKSFDKKDKKQVSCWRVIVREKQKTVNLYCPECWKFAQNLLSSIGRDLEGLSDV